MSNIIQTEILAMIKKQSNFYPVTIKELEEYFEYSNSLIHRHIKKLEGKGFIKAKRVAKPKGGVTYYKTPKVEWPKHLGKKCFDCHNKSTISICIFYEELADMGIKIKPERVGVKLTENTVACEYFMKRKTHWNRKRLEEFLDEIRRITKTDYGFKISYHCVKCGAELSTLGSGFIAKLGSSVLRCGECDSFYKILFDYKKKVFKVHYNKEKGLEYKRKFLEVAGESNPEKLYSSESHGIAIPELQLSKFNFRTRTLTVSNWVGKLEELNYIVAKKEEDYRYLEELLEAKGYKEISLILGMDKLVSPAPTKQKIGLLRLLRAIMIINKEFCIAMLISRITIIERIHELFDREREVLVKKAKMEIKRVIEEVKQKPWITPKEW
ncbi:MAG: winged helix-turn-helix transcriptional regulator, partial [Candidatus Heimdallarchaeota archaeon]|nr:winged helix-turn-helix transcriptional regulator [Candidatus Heimdallarchaeota archaeon]